ncbi:hypothetical protein L7F22_069312 [Adiantum nelumboides]|nr:hypothetical protein [Adiantum nelumboides]
MARWWSEYQNWRTKEEEYEEFAQTLCSEFLDWQTPQQEEYEQFAQILCSEFVNWQTPQEEILAYDNQFLALYFEELPIDLIKDIKTKVWKSIRQQWGRRLLPFSAPVLPNHLQSLMKFIYQGRRVDSSTQAGSSSQLDTIDHEVRTEAEEAASVGPTQQPGSSLSGVPVTPEEAVLHLDPVITDPDKIHHIFFGALSWSQYHQHQARESTRFKPLPRRQVVRRLLQPDSESDSEDDESDSDEEEELQKKQKKGKGRSNHKSKKDKKTKKKASDNLDRKIAETLKAMGVTTPPRKTKLYCNICKKDNHDDAHCFYNPKNRREVVQQTSPQANTVQTDNRGPRGPPRRFQQRSWGPPALNTCGASTSAGACTYCGGDHRQGPDCPLWCKHREERGIPIIRYDQGKQQMQQNPTPQTNVVIVEELEVKDSKELNDTKVLHIDCDCSTCIQVEDVLEAAAEVLAVTRSGKEFRNESDISDLSLKDSKVWDAQQECRNKVLKQVQKLRNRILEIGEDSEQQKMQEQVAAEQADNRFKKGLQISKMMEQTTITLDQLLSLVPAFQKEILTQFLGSDDNLDDVHTMHRLTIRRDKKKIRLNMVPIAVLPVYARALHAEPISAAHGIEDDEEEEFLQANESVIRVYDIDVVKIVEQYKSSKQGKSDDKKAEQHNQSDMYCAMHSSTPKQKQAVFEFAMKTQRSTKEQGISRRSARTKPVVEREVESHSDSTEEEIYEVKSKGLRGLAADLMFPMQDFVVTIDLQDNVNKLWLQKLRLWNFACLEWERHRNNIYAPTQLLSLKKGQMMLGAEQELTVAYFAEVFQLSNDGIREWEKSNEGMMKREFGSPEGTRAYYMIRKVPDAGRRKQLMWLMERIFFIIKTTYMSRDTYGLVAAVEQNQLALKLSAVQATPAAKATQGSKKERVHIVDSEDEEEPPEKKQKLEEEVSDSHKSTANVQQATLSDTDKLDCPNCPAQAAVDEIWSDFNQKLESTSLRVGPALEKKDRGKAVLKISKQKLLFNKDKSASGKSFAEHVKEKHTVGSADRKVVALKNTVVIANQDMTGAIQQLQEAIQCMRNYSIQVDILNQQRREFEEQSVKSVKHDVLTASINQIRSDLVRDLEIKSKESELLSVQLQESQLQFQTVKEWLQEFKEQFFSELKVIADSNSELQIENLLLNNRLQVLQSVEEQLKESVEDIEVEVKEISDDEQKFRLINEDLINQVQIRDYKIDLIELQNTILKNQVELQMVQSEETTVKGNKLQSNTHMHSLLTALHTFQANSDSVLSFNEDWQVVAALLNNFDAGETDVQSKDTVATISDVSRAHKHSLDVVQNPMAVNLLDTTIDELIVKLDADKQDHEKQVSDDQTAENAKEDT